MRNENITLLALTCISCNIRGDKIQKEDPSRDERGLVKSGLRGRYILLFPYNPKRHAYPINICQTIS